MKKKFTFVAIFIATVCVVFTLCGCGLERAKTNYDFISSLIKKKNLVTIENTFIPILEEGDEKIVDKIFYWVKDNRNTTWSCIEFWVEDNSTLINYAQELCDESKFDKRKVGMFTQDFHQGILIRLYSNTVRVEDWYVEKFADFGLRTTDQFLELNPGTDVSERLTGEYYIF